MDLKRHKVEGPNLMVYYEDSLAAKEGGILVSPSPDGLRNCALPEVFAHGAPVDQDAADLDGHEFYVEPDKVNPGHFAVREGVFITFRYPSGVRENVAGPAELVEYPPPSEEI